MKVSDERVRELRTRGLTAEGVTSACEELLKEAEADARWHDEGRQVHLNKRRELESRLRAAEEVVGATKDYLAFTDAKNLRRIYDALRAYDEEKV